MNEGKERHGCVSVWLWLAIITNFCCAIYYVVSMFGTFTSSHSLGLGLLSICATLNILGTILLMRWIKYGFYVLLTGFVLIAIVNVGILSMEPYFLVPNILSLLFWWGILQIRKDGVSAWNLLELGWDYKHCRHLYQFFGVIMAVLLVLTIVALPRHHDGYSNKNLLSSDDSEKVIEEPVEEEPVEVEEQIVWKTFSDKNKICSIEAPDDFRTAELSADQTLGLMCTDYDPAVVIISEEANVLKISGIRTTKDYADAIVKMCRNAEGGTGFVKISENKYAEDSYLIVYSMTVDKIKFRYSLLTSRTKSKFYYCQVYCLDQYAEKLQPTISHMLESFKALK